MSQYRIAALFDAENIGCEMATIVLNRLRQLGTVQSACAVGDFSTVKQWVDCGRDNGIDLVMQPSLGKGKNSADIRLTIEAMDLIHRGRVDAIALVTHDRDFTPLAFRLREAGLVVLGFGSTPPTSAFSVACSSFEVIGLPAKPSVAVPQPSNCASLSNQDRESLVAIARKVCAQGTVGHAVLSAAVKSDNPQLAAKLKGKFLKTLVAHRIVERVGKGEAQQLRQVA